FKSLAQQVDPLINESGDLNGVLVHACKFPGWDSFASFVAQIQFVNGHHKHLKKVALCTDTLFGTLVEKLGAHFVAAEIKVFPIMSW
ncbi:MAG: STAS/SEC14 domain-containing protein, partial [Methylococcaceae bacterium]